MANQEGTAQHRAAKETGDKYVAERLGEYADRARAEKIPAGTDTSGLNAEKAKREGWSNTGGSRD